ncbi:cysteine--tRNA ligase [Candidatus Daviesbacteria bacterium]|nr:cysteine--tRNA ligase [Candidatus Daviesbacteria bacterium]
MKIFNSLSGRLEEFKPLSKGKVNIYVCGITPYDTTHLGHAFTYISFDVLIRYLKFKGFNVNYTQNVTDINDRDKDILERAKKLNVPWNKLADFWTQKFLTDMAALNWVFPNHYLKASKQIPQVIDLIQKLLKKSLAYRVNDSVYLDISKISDYGKLSEYNQAKMLKIAPNFEEDLECPEKRNPLDITLWRATKPNQPAHIPSFPSPYGAGRPGWHIECSAISISSLGEQIDIHGGGRDLKFPHHEAEIAQSEGATGKIPFAKYWLHTGVVYYQGEKMSKSKGNLVMVSELLKKYSCNAIRWLLLSHRWNKTWEFTEEKLIKAQKKVDFIEKILALQNNTSQSELIHQFTQILDNNLDTPKALQFLLRLAKQNNPGLKKLYEVLGFLN